MKYKPFIHKREEWENMIDMDAISEAKRFMKIWKTTRSKRIREKNRNRWYPLLEETCHKFLDNVLENELKKQINKFATYETSSNSKSFKFNR